MEQRLTILLTSGCDQLLLFLFRQGADFDPKYVDQKASVQSVKVGDEGLLEWMPGTWKFC